MNGAAGVINDEWLSELLGRPAFRLAVPPLHSEELHLPTGPIFVTAKIGADKVGSVGLLERAGFSVIETALTFTAGALTAAPDERVRFADPGDEAGVRSVAAQSFRFSRFHIDPAVPYHLADRIKAEWAGNFFRGRRGDGMIVARIDGRIVGFLQLLWDASGVLVIDLIATAPEAARRGLATAMIGLAATAGTGGGRRPAGFRVGTQAANVPSCRLYETLGFRLSGATYVLHHHGSSVDYGGTREASA